MINDKIHLLVTIDKNYSKPFQTMLKSLVINNPQEMYYRLLAPHILPASLEKVLYVDPDILVINPIRPLWDKELKGNTFAAVSAMWTGLCKIRYFYISVGIKSRGNRHMPTGSALYTNII